MNNFNEMRNALEGVMTVKEKVTASPPKQERLAQIRMGRMGLVENFACQTTNRANTAMPPQSRPITVAFFQLPLNERAVMMGSRVFPVPR